MLTGYSVLLNIGLTHINTTYEQNNNDDHNKNIISHLLIMLQHALQLLIQTNVSMDSNEYCVEKSIMAHRKNTTQLNTN